MYTTLACILVMSCCWLPPDTRLQASRVPLIETQSGSKRQTSDSKPEILDIRAEKRERTLSEIQTISSRVLQFKDVEARSIVLSGLAGLLWKEDEPTSRQLFLKAYELLTNASTPDDPYPGQRKLSPKYLAYLRQQVIAEISRRDANWASRLIDQESRFDQEDARVDKSETYLSAAFNLIEDSPDRALEFAEKSLGSGLSERMVDFIQQLRLKNETAANAIFISALNQLAAQPFVNAQDLLLLGNYIFTAPLSELPSDAILITSVGGVLVQNISADRPGIAPAVLRQYLETAVNILTRQISDPRQKQLYYLAAYQLMPRVKQWLPDRAQLLATSMASLVPSIPPALTNDSTYANLGRTSLVGDTDEELREIEKIPSEQRREGRYLSLTFSLYRRKDFSQARVVAQRIKDLQARGQLDTLIDFGSAAKTLQSGEFTKTAEIANKLPAGIERAILWLGLAHAYLKAERNTVAAEAIDDALRDTRKVGDARRPFLIFAAATAMTHIDRLRAMEIGVEAVKAFNNESRDSLASIRWTQPVTCGSARRDFPLTIEGIQLDFASAVRDLVDAEPERAAEMTSELKDENLLGQALLAVVRNRLTSLNRKGRE